MRPRTTPFSCNSSALLRSKYLARNEGEDSTFHSVVLAGVHDVKNIEQYSSKDTAFVEKLAASTAPDCNRQSL
ncbi:MAG: hypothetical protein QTN59_01670 [Candidatus Electrothrix communis]|nr:MAG: hypothetical protein QTN59_01670 [Candidatus Electrothrix communis]